MSLLNPFCTSCDVSVFSWDPILCDSGLGWGEHPLYVTREAHREIMKKNRQQAMVYLALANNIDPWIQFDLKNCQRSGNPPFLDSDSVLCHIAQEILGQRILHNCKEVMKPSLGLEAEILEVTRPEDSPGHDEEWDENDEWGEDEAWDEEHTRGKWW